jgi:endoglucanase
MNLPLRSTLIGTAVFIGSICFAAEPSAPAIRLNTLGYLPDAPKHATVAGKVSAFSVLRLPGGESVFSGKLGESRHDADSNEDVHDADFSALQTPGEYRLAVEGAGESAPFKIAGDLYREPLFLVTRAMYLWRCGVAVDGTWHGVRFHHDACHLQDAWLDFVNGKHEQLPSTGGWHDAGDYNKYIVNAGITVGAMLRAWEDFPTLRSLHLDIPESGGALPDYLAEIKFEVDWLLTMQAPDGSVYWKVSTERFGAFVLPEKETTPRYVCPWGSASTADFVAMLAQAERAFRPYAPEYADRCLAAARKSYAFLRANPEDHAADQAKFRTGGYTTKDDDDRLWAATEMWVATGDASCLADVETRIRAMSPHFDENFDWAEVKNLGLLTYLNTQREGRDAALVASVAKNLAQTADRIVAKAHAHLYARPLGDIYYWGGNGGVARQTLLLQAAFRQTGRSVYRDTALDAVNHLFGRNVHGRSYVTGLGAMPPLNPHDRRSGGDAVEQPWPGYLVGGPHPKARDWHDVLPDASTNEIAINWNAALIYALAGFLPADSVAQ